MATKAEIRDRAAELLGILTIGQALANQHATRIETAYDEVYAQLKSDGLATWASTASTPAEVTPHVAALVAYNCLNSYGVPLERFNRIVGAKMEGEREIRKFTTAAYVSMDEPTDF